jgi:type I restriction enzyme M protein
MDSQTYNQLVSFIWGIANDCLVDTYDVGDYRKVILPMTVIRRFDAVLENTKDAVITERDRLKADKWKDMDSRLCTIAGEAFCNHSDYTLKQLTAITSRAELKKTFIAYLDGFSKNVQDIIDKFGFRGQIDKLSNSNTLGILIQKFVNPRINLSNRPVLDDDGSIKQPALDNHTMGMVFEEVIRRFNEETNVTDAGRHFTPRDIVQLMADLAFIPVQDIIKAKNDTYTIYDGACGTGGMLTVGEERILEIAKAGGKKASIHIFGRENAEETYAIARSDMLLKGAVEQAAEQADNIKFGSTISNDKFREKTFNFMLSNPPFGTSWKKELDSDEWGGIKKDEISDTRFVINYDGGEFRMTPDVDDPQMLFLANNVSKMKKANGHISRIVEVHNGSSLFTGKAGQGSTNLRRYIIEKDMLEAIIALPEKMFYNTGIGTYLWVLTCKKTDARRKGKVQLINATSLKSSLRKNIGEKNCEITEPLREQIMDIYAAFDEADSECSIVLDNADFGYYSVQILRPLYGEDGKPLTETKGKNKGKVVINKDLSDTEIVPMTYPGGVTAFVENEVKPYAEDAWYEEDSVKIGYEISFTKYFYRPTKLRKSADIASEIRSLEGETDGLLEKILGGLI